MNGDLFKTDVSIKDNLIFIKSKADEANQAQTNSAFSEKWEYTAENAAEKDLDMLAQTMHRNYLSQYGFDSEEALAKFLQTKKVILDAGCGGGIKTAWFAQLAPNSTVIGMDFSEGCMIAAKKYAALKNLYFIRGDIADTPFKPGVVDYVNCDQVIHHTENPPKTFAHLTSLIAPNGEFACYVYAKKALPRELLDEYFRTHVHNSTKEQIWELSKQMTQLGKILTDLHINITVPDIPMLQIKGGEYDLQRFLYWNFLKCYWNAELGEEVSNIINFDWWAPSNAYRYSEEEYKKIIADNNLKIIFFHSEEACYSGRFVK